MAVAAAKVLLVSFALPGLASALRPGTQVVEKAQDEAVHPEGNDVPLWNLGGRKRVVPLATISDRDNPMTFRGLALNFNAVPVFESPEKDGYIALLQRWGYSNDDWGYNDNTRWNVMKAAEKDITCVSGGGEGAGYGLEYPVEIHGGESPRAMKTWFVVRCPVPAVSFGKMCHEIVLQDRGEPFGKVRSCQVDEDTTMSEFQDREVTQSTLTLKNPKFGVAACVKPLYHSTTNPGMSGMLKLPQWLEYNIMHGVEHFVVYTFSKSFPGDRALTLDILSPYLESGVVSIVDFEQTYARKDAQRFAHEQVVNDCLYRMMHRTEWLMPSLDVDEYVSWKDGFTETTPFLGHLNGIAKPDTFSITMQRYGFEYPADPFQNLDIGATTRGQDIQELAGKYICRPELVHNVFIHWVVTGVDDESDHNLSVHPEDLVAFHYRLGPEEIGEDKKVEDVQLALQEGALATRLETRYGFSPSELLQRLEAKFRLRGPSALINLGNVSDERDEELDEERFAHDFHDFIHQLLPVA